MATMSAERAEFEQAKNHVLRFGKHKGATLNQAAETDEGLLYLDWLIGQDWLREDLEGDLRIFLAYEPVAKDVDKAIDDREERRSR